VSLHFFESHTSKETWKETRGKCVLRPTNRRDFSTPAVKNQSASAAPGIATAPRSGVQVPMVDPTVLGEVSVSVSILPAASVVSDEEEEKEEDEESSHSDDEEDVDDINHATLSSTT
jgi:hypothetical protein